MCLPQPLGHQAGLQGARVDQGDVLGVEDEGGGLGGRTYTFRRIGKQANNTIKPRTNNILFSKYAPFLVQGQVEVERC